MRLETVVLLGRERERPATLPVLQPFRNASIRSHFPIFERPGTPSSLPPRRAAVSLDPRRVSTSRPSPTASARAPSVPPCRDLLRELLPCDRPGRERRSDRRERVPQPFLCHADHSEPRTLPPPIVCAQCGDVKGKVRCSQEVKRPAYGPGPNQGPLLPERIADVDRRNSVDSSPDL